MIQIEPFWRWQDFYVSSEDKKSPFFGRTYNTFENKIYDYLIHPNWDDIGSETIYLKILFVDYDTHFAVIEMIGEWNDALENDILQIRQEVTDRLSEHGICKFLLIGENVLNFHGDNDDYYAEWFENLQDEEGWVALANFQEHVLWEMRKYKLHQYFHWGPLFINLPWQRFEPELLFQICQDLVDGKRPKWLSAP